MVFSSVAFIWLFLPASLVLYLAAPPRRRNLVFASLSFVFYAWGAHGLVLLLLVITAANYGAGLAIGSALDRDDERATRLISSLAIAANLAVLFAWKYEGFAIRQLNQVLPSFGAGPLATPAALLPIGISFITFHSISYLLDVRRGRSRPLRSIVDFGQYMVFFPQLIAGPIVRFHEIEDQLRNPPARSRRMVDLSDGFPRFALGLSKKVLLADPLGVVVGAAFSPGVDPSGATAWVGALAFTFQIYFDFSGYSDMAIGLARMFGFTFPENFTRPYSAVSITDFWRRWHRTLSRWFRDYVYVPLGGSRGSTASGIRNLMIVFALTGIWHGAGWTFLVWGLYNGALIALERVTGIARMADQQFAAVRRLLAFGLVVTGWVLFRANDLHQAGQFYRAMFSLPFGSTSSTVHIALTGQAELALAIGFATVLLPRTFATGALLQGEWHGVTAGARLVVLLALPLAAFAVLAGSFSPFLYFQF